MDPVDARTGRESPSSRAERGARVRLFVVHWDEDGLRGRLESLRRTGLHVRGGPVGPQELRVLRASPPDVLAVDLTRWPSRGRDVAVAWRSGRRTRHVPLALLGGEPESVARVRVLLPDAIYADWGAIDAALAEALATGRRWQLDLARGVAPLVVVPRDLLAGYSGTPLARKLGLGEHHLVRLVDAPRGFESALAPMPDGARTARRATKQAPDVVVWFVRSAARLDEGLQGAAAEAGDGVLWVCWPKKSSGLSSDLSADVVRERARGSGLVLSQVVAVDRQWSAIGLTRRR